MKISIALTAVILAVLALGVWIVMLLFGGLADVFNMPNLAISFWQTLIVYITLLVIGSFFKESK